MKQSVTRESVLRSGGRLWIVLIAVFLVGLWAGIPALKKWEADKLVDELCAKDGGVRVHETAEYPQAHLPPNWAAKIPFKDRRKPSDEFYFVYTGNDIRGNRSSTDTSALTVYRIEIALYRTLNDKLLGVTVGYSRRGGDAIGPWHPSAYSCPPNATEWDLVRKTLIEPKR